MVEKSNISKDWNEAASAKKGAGHEDKCLHVLLFIHQNNCDMPCWITRGKHWPAPIGWDSNTGKLFKFLGGIKTFVLRDIH